MCTPTWANQGTGSGACTYHDTPLSNFWYKYSGGNIEAEEFLRLACIDSTGGGSSLILHECQRYMDSTAWGHLSTVTSCPASDDICDGDGKDTWQCSSEVRGGMYLCPEGAASMEFCPDFTVCEEPSYEVTESMDPSEHMCASAHKFSTYSLLSRALKWIRLGGRAL